MTDIRDLWYTPDHIKQRIQKFFGSDYFDPCPVNPTFNGLETGWGWRSFINPPYSTKLKNEFIDYGLKQYKHHIGSRYLWLVNYRNSVALTKLHKYADAICVPDTRIRFVPGHPSLGDGESPRHDSIFILWGNIAGFHDNFHSLGKVYVNIHS